MSYNYYGGSVINKELIRIEKGSITYDDEMVTYKEGSVNQELSIK